MTVDAKDQYHYFRLNFYDNNAPVIIRKEIIKSEYEITDKTLSSFNDYREVIDKLEEEHKGKTDVRFHIHGDYDGCLIWVVIWYELETAEEFEARCQKSFDYMLETKRKNREYNERKASQKAAKKARREERKKAILTE